MKLMMRRRVTSNTWQKPHLTYAQFEATENPTIGLVLKYVVQ
jgi:hypothetical protein